MRIIQLDTTCVIAERWPTEPFAGQFPDPRFQAEVVRYEVGFHSRRLSIREAENLTVVSLKHSYGWEGDEQQFADWGRGAGLGQVARHISQLVNRLIDIVQTTFDESDENPFPHLRHLGIRDFVLLDSLFGHRRQNLISTGSLAMDAKLGPRTFGVVSKVNFETADCYPVEKTKIIRAVELLNCGYHTEALLISFSVLDSAVKQAIRRMFGENLDVRARDVEKAIQLKKRGMPKLMKNLGPRLKRLVGHSLEKEDPQLWKNLDSCIGYRNEAIHDSVDVSYEKAKLCIETVRDIFSYLRNLPPAKAPGLSCDPYVPSLGLERLPFLLEYK